MPLNLLYTLHLISRNKINATVATKTIRGISTEIQFGLCVSLYDTD